MDENDPASAGDAADGSNQKDTHKSNAPPERHTNAGNDDDRDAEETKVGHFSFLSACLHREQSKKPKSDLLEQTYLH